MGKEEKLLKEARGRLKQAIEFDAHNRKEQVDDLKFLSGKQWSDDEENKRTLQGRPVLTVNKLPKFVKQIVGDIRQNRPRIKVRPLDSNADIHLAQIREGIIRNIEYKSVAESIYDQAAEMAVACGIGAWRVITDWADDKGFEQEILIESIKNPFCVYLDPKYYEKGPQHAEWGFITKKIKREDYKDEYGADPVDNLSEGQGAQYEHWYDKATVTVAEYFVKEFEEKTLVLLSNGEVVEKDAATPEALAAMSQEPESRVTNEHGVFVRRRPPVTVVKERVSRTAKIKRYLINAFDVLEPAKDWPGKYIPIVVIEGETLNIEGKRHVRGLIRFARDPQKMLNYWRTIGAETIALAPKSPFIGTAKQFEGYEKQWAEANVKNYPYLPYKSDPAAPGPPARNAAAAVPPGIFTEAQVAEKDMEDTTSIFKAAQGQTSNEKSGKAIMARQRESDVANFVYMDNLARGIAYTGKIILDLIPKIYDTERDARLHSVDGSEQFVPINTTAGKAIQSIRSNPSRYSGMDAKRLGEHIMRHGDGALFNDMSVGEFDAIVEAGPPYTTQRIESADNMMRLIQSVPKIADVAGDLIVKNMDFVEADVLAERLKKTLPPGLVELKQGEQPPPPPPPNPKMVVEMKKLEMEEKHLMLEMEKLKVEMSKIQSNAQGTDDHIRQVVIGVLKELHAPTGPGMSALDGAM